MADDFRRLKAEADIKYVCESIGVNFKKRGSSYFLHCPDKLHHDKTASNAYFKDGWNNVYCQSCGKSTTAIDLIMNTQGMDYKEAVNLLWNIMGNPDWFKDNSWKSKTKPKYRIKGDDAKFIGIQLSVLTEGKFCLVHDVLGEEKYKQLIVRKTVEVLQRAMKSRDFAKEIGFMDLAKGFQSAIDRCDKILDEVFYYGKSNAG